MGKLAVTASATGVAGTSAIAFYGAYALGAFGGSGDKQIPKKPFVHNKSLKELTKNDGNKCLSGVFNNGSNVWDVNKISEDENLSEIKVPEDIRLDGSSTNSTGGCFDYKVVVGDIQESNHFRFVWAITRNTKGLAFYVSSEGKDDKNVQFNGAI